MKENTKEQRRKLNEVSLQQSHNQSQEAYIIPATINEKINKVEN